MLHDFYRQLTAMVAGAGYRATTFYPKLDTEYID